MIQFLFDTFPLIHLHKIFLNPLYKNNNPEDGNCNIHQNIWKPSTFDVAYPQTPKLYNIDIS